MFSVTCAVILYLSVLPTQSQCAWCCFSALGWVSKAVCLGKQAGDSVGEEMMSSG